MSRRNFILPPLLQKFLHFKGLIFSAVILLFGVTNFVSLSSKKSWPQVDATVSKSASSADPSDSQKALLDFSYRYRIDGRSTSSSSVFASTFRKEPKFADDVAYVVSRYPVGSVVRAYVNPEDPFDSYLDLSASTIDYVLPGVGAACLVCFGVYYIRVRKKKSA
jgi:hypothetical protein